MDIHSLTILVAKMTVLLLLAATVAGALRRAPAAVRHQVWLATLAGVLMLPALLALAPVSLPVLPAELAWASASAVAAPVLPAGREPRAEAAARPLPSAAVPVRADREVLASTPRFERPRLDHLLAGVWAAVALLLLGWLAAGRLAVRRIVRSARPLDGARVPAITCDLADRVGLDHLPAVLASDRVEIPFATGLWGSTIVLPAAAAGWTEDRLRHVLLHELAHVRRRDLFGHTLGRLACAVYWFHPLVWTAARRLRAESERACDDAVLDCGVRASDYAGHILDIVAAARRISTPAVALPMARRRELEGRVLAILDPGRASRRAPRRGQSAAVLGLLGVLFSVVAASAPSVRATARPEAESPAVEAAHEETARPVSAPAAMGMASAVRAARAEAQPAPPAPAAPPVAAGRRDPSPPEGVRHPENRALLIRVLRTDSDAEVREAAAWALKEATQPDAEDALVAALRGDADGEVREMAAWALADVRQEAAVAAMAEALRKDQEAEVRATAAWALGQRRGGDTTVLRAALADADPEVREAAAWALGQQRLEKAPAELVALLGDGEDDVRLVAAWALGEIRDPSTVSAVKAAFAKETDDEVRQALFRALVLLGDRSRPTLEQALASKDPELRSRAVQMLAGGGAGHWSWPWPWPQPRPQP